MTLQDWRSLQATQGAHFVHPAAAAFDFGSLVAEFAAITTSAAIADWSARGVLTISGSDSRKFLHNFCTNDIRGLSSGQGCEAFVCNVQGKVLAHILVAAEQERLWLTCGRTSLPTLLKHLQKYHINEQVSFEDPSAEYVSLYLTGPASNQLLVKMYGPDAAIEIKETATLDHNGSGVFARRFDLYGTPGYELLCPVESVATFWAAVIAAGAAPVGTAADNAARILAGFPEYGVDVTADNLAQEVSRTKQAISFTKGCYLGQEPIARIDALGHVNKLLCVLRIAGLPLPPQGTEIVTDDEPVKTIGSITSSALFPADSTAVALAYMKRSFESPGLNVRVKNGDATHRAKIVSPGAIAKLD